MRISCITALLLALPLRLAIAQSRAPLPQKTLSVVGAAGLARSNHDGRSGSFGFIGLEARSPTPFLRIRLEGLFANMAGGQSVSAVAFTTVVAPLRRVTTPYVLSTAAVVDSGGPRRAWSFGLGMQSAIRGRVVFVEARMYSFFDPAVAVPHDDTWSYFNVPISIGVRF